MIRTIAVACLLAALAGPALAATPMPPDRPTPECSGLAQDRARARAAAAPLSYDVFDLDGENAREFQRVQDVPAKDQSDHLTVMVNPKTGRGAALLSNGPGCSFGNVFAVMTPPAAEPLDAALDLLRLAR